MCILLFVKPFLLYCLVLWSFDSTIMRGSNKNGREIGYYIVNFKDIDTVFMSLGLLEDTMRSLLSAGHLKQSLKNSRT